MVALREEYTFEIAHSDRKNRGWDFYSNPPESVRTNRLGSQDCTGETAYLITIRRQGAALSQGEQRNQLSEGWHGVKGWHGRWQGVRLRIIVWRISVDGVGNGRTE